MKKIGILSDTHGYLHPRIPDFFAGTDEIWHAGDIGSVPVTENLQELKPLRAVYGNIDGQEIRALFPGIQIFRVEEVKVLMTHIGGYPGRYEPPVAQLIGKERPQLFVCGHSHILKVIYDKKYRLLHVNPGAAGRYGLHRSVTAIRLVIEGTEIRDLEVIDLKRI